MNFKNANDNDLVEEAQTGLRGQGAVVEMMGRLKNAIIEQDRSTKRLNKILLYFTIAAFVLSFIQVILLIIEFYRKVL
ncbi:MAG: hypothetical protein AAB600_03110 [Patescibacteria group bacterium]